MGSALAKLDGIAELVPRTHAVRARLAALGPAAAVDALEALLGSSAHPDLLLACGLALIEADVAPLRRSAAERAPRTAHFLADAPPHRALSPHGRLRDVSMLEERAPAVPRFLWYAEPIYDDEVPAIWDDRAWPAIIGHERHAIPMSLNPRVYARFRRELRGRAALHPSPRFLARFVRGRDATPETALAIAARRPTTAAIVRVLLEHAPSIELPQVRLAVACNPFTPTRVALLLVPSCRPQLGTIARSNVHPLVRGLARRLVRGER